LRKTHSPGAWPNEGRLSALHIRRACEASLRRLQTDHIDLYQMHIEALTDFLRGKRDFLLALLQNPTLLEHEAFSDLLWAVFHLADELAHRRDLKQLSDTDCAHLAGDMAHVQKHLVAQWSGYMQHLKHDYPFLFSLALRTNPFDPEAQVEVGLLKNPRHHRHGACPKGAS